jgi:sulfate transport system permease protein
MPLHVEILYNEYDMVGAFSVAALLCLLAIATLMLKAVVERLQPQITDAMAPQTAAARS